MNGFRFKRFFKGVSLCGKSQISLVPLYSKRSFWTFRSGVGMKKKRRRNSLFEAMKKKLATCRFATCR